MENKLFINFKFNNNEIGTLDIALNDKHLDCDKDMVIDFSGADSKEPENPAEPIEEQTEIKEENTQTEEAAKEPIVAFGKNAEKPKRNFRLHVTDFKGNKLAILKKQIIGMYETKHKRQVHTAIKVKYPHSITCYYIPERFAEVMKLYNEGYND